ncbi:riboflavin biosynthesis pyrimidine reductase [Catenuloplanes nepalensis]|uniref:Riboflavin biosynthesis pyrimidine reductase n=1 Tax=Catenuloplanes nepalensis TaxID=587533 RepID=A0ABT9MZM0_9ACTN|nr:pyrimidine reductase family protein [Catenuloplanes nepalensis]MDP9796895.1 riboflavin biosynthesis pyrimidine reductase [Catenuloplanes nepalensis]
MNELVTGPDLDDETLIGHYGRPPRPALRVSFVSSADGAMEIDGLSTALSGADDKRVFGVLRMLADAVLVGAGTLRRENYRPIRLSPPRIEWRRAHGLPDVPTLVTVSHSLDLDPAMPALAEAPVRPIVLTSSATHRPDLAKVADVLRFDDQELLPPVRARGLDHILCEGGPRLFGTLLAADAVDELCLTVAPVLAGAGASRITAGPPAPPRSMRVAHVLRGGDHLMVRYVRRHP